MLPVAEIYSDIVTNDVEEAVIEMKDPVPSYEELMLISTQFTHARARLRQDPGDKHGHW